MNDRKPWGFFEGVLRRIICAIRGHSPLGGPTPLRGAGRIEDDLNQIVEKLPPGYTVMRAEIECVTCGNLLPLRTNKEQTRCRCGRIYTLGSLPEKCPCGVEHFGSWARINARLHAAARGAQLPKHRPHCSGDCDEGRECWRMNLLSPEDAARRGIKLLDEEDVRRMVDENGSGK